MPTPYLLASTGVKGMNSNVTKTSSRPTQRQGGGGEGGGIAGWKRGVRETWLRRVRPDHAFQGGGRVRPGEDGVRPGEDGVRQGGDRLSRVGVG